MSVYDTILTRSLCSLYLNLYKLGQILRPSLNYFTLNTVLMLYMINLNI